jgi:hypothetical protein
MVSPSISINAAAVPSTTPTALVLTTTDEAEMAARTVMSLLDFIWHPLRSNRF